MFVLCLCLSLCLSMASSFKIPKRKPPSGSDSDLHMLSPLSRLQSSAPQLKVLYLKISWTFTCSYVEDHSESMLFCVSRATVTSPAEEEQPRCIVGML